ncbi:carboxy-S-adenosyl-L-methionine synthase CmoA [Catenovulum sp. 2E275]|uniref:carboxy-S-adenosyl-L-methionine synthase CmoA n=1 Tax=Catenovulum sp. 2E275 TaxID=2980497 RepID=UPI0021D3AAA8|nr:carboxy-S-adenosyl-L-methionine synthase CmoA [Catenovulum sp. 2E275]MCU4674608.1 carboxy-S-adenosyl-L-methionine synthase CmoA [Catenovulum sp. 2E275]
MSNLDNIYSTPQQTVKDFVFDETVVDVFPDMIQRSVPGYQTIISTIGHLAQNFAQTNSHIYDLGCSLGAATLAMRRSIQAQGCQIYAVDTSAAMVERCQMHLSNFKSQIKTDVICADAVDFEIKNASVVVLNFTLQFISPDKRIELINKIYQGLNPGGILVLSEKLRFDTPAIQNTLDELHLDFKRAHGYSELEIAQKRTAIENVMLTDTLEIHFERFKQAGFSQFSQWYQCFNFTSMLAIK